jgi:hypothetical protein
VEGAPGWIALARGTGRDGRVHTREVKRAVFFTQDKLDKNLPRTNGVPFRKCQQQVLSSNK